MAPNLKSGSIVVACLLTGSCDWVDSTGVQREVPDTVEPVVRLVEDTEKSVDFSTLIARNLDESAQVNSWRKINEGRLQECEGIIDLELAPETLEEACSPTEDICKIIVQQSLDVNGDPDDYRFNVLPPQLSAPVGVTYQWIFTDDTDNTESHDVTFCVDAVNDAPVANADEYSIAPDGSLLIGDVIFDDLCGITNDSQSVLVNDTDDRHIQTDCITAELLTVPAYASNDMAGSFTVAGGFVYAPDPDRPFPTDNFTYRLFDGQHSSEIATVTIRSGIEAINDEYNVQRNSSNVFLLPLTNDSNPFNSTLSLVAITAEPNRGGEVNLASDTALVYRPRQNFRGVERFDYSMQDSHGQISTATVTVTVD